MANQSKNRETDFNNIAVHTEILIEAQTTTPVLPEVHFMAIHMNRYSQWPATGRKIGRLTFY